MAYKFASIRTETPCGLVDAIVLTPDEVGETLRIELRGNVAAMLGHQKNEEVVRI